MRSIVTCVGVFLVACLCQTTASGDMLYDWDGDPAGTLQVQSDPNDYAGSDTREITAVMYARDADTHYFRMDLAAAPALNDAASEYAIQIDSMAGGGHSGNSNYIANNLVDIDQLVMSHYSAGGGLYTDHHRHNFTPPAGVDKEDLVDIGGTVDNTEDGGRTLQWAVPFGSLEPGPFRIYGATLNLGEPSTYDITITPIQAAAIPEPGTCVLLSIGLIFAGVCRLRRRS